MDNITRRKEILAALKKHGKVNTIELAEKMNVSPMTIRRDFTKFAQEGLITVEYGGAILKEGYLFEDSMVTKQDQYPEEKARIAQKCAEYIKEGDSVYLDAGTTVCEIAKQIRDRRNLIVVTHSLLVANALAHSPGIKVIMMPGEYREFSMAYMGELTNSYITRFHIDKTFLGVEGIDLKNGVTVPDIIDGASKRTLAEHSDKVICVADSSKIGKTTFFKICEVEDLQILVTDKGISEKAKEELISSGLNLQIV
ncbi:DeoR/GlpR transcriptional regulator [Eubacterium sp. am_0171]|uniref:DeoR/GlpR family DNA-binding transcription regulator n=1 Tax=unclassified Eubacterium (in: firmicutes) TaxID=2624479 RepID=UPI0010204395|nr:MULTISPECIES: DeoR/GlpR family DNA-binding transcription regulator [unclassified Eubacterium (in: firmicutes)]MSC86330.1 DeoR family transcriptional regulator [Eubacterium sp. BIOML-A1]MSD08669.1 DeoR family transcriptional regulator [Eubacterium sp. BIOML-A2]RYT11624.1 DeoR/GlpR transcriptional regulator [Eubacterium sp. am_0171]